MSKQQIPIACDMKALPDREAHEQVGSQLMPQVQHITDLEAGYEIGFPIDARELVSKFVDGERRCCPFIYFELHIPPASDTVILRLHGSGAVKAFLKQQLIPLLSSER